MTDKKKTQVKNLAALLALALILAAAGLINRFAKPAMEESTGGPVEVEAFRVSETGE